MDPVMLALALRGSGMILSFLAGILALVFGYRLYRDGTGSEKDAVTLEFFGGKAKAASVGSVVMATAVMWGALGAYVSPSYNKTGDTVTVYSFESPGSNVTSRALATKAPRSASVTSDPVALRGLFQTAVRTAEAGDAGAMVTVDGVPASFDMATLKTARGQDGVQVTADFHAGSQTASLVFTPELERGKVIFVPTESTTMGDTASNE